MKSLIKNGKIITRERIIEGASILIHNGKILEISDKISDDKVDTVIDAKGKYISPGFIDIHVHGGGGYDFMDGTIEAIIKASKAHMPYGTTSILPTTLTADEYSLFNTLDNFKKVKEDYYDTPNILGLHLEGPYFDYEQRGAQDPEYIRDPDPSEYMKILDYSDDIVRWTIAPERPGALELGRVLTEKKIIASIGHTNAVYEEVVEAFENGYNLLTHFYSGMSMVRRINAFRYPGVVESGYLIDEMNVEIIADGMHLPASLLKLIYKIKGSDRICLVTDAMRGAGMPDGEYMLGNIDSGQMVIVEEGVAKIQSREAFAGSVATTDRLVRNMIELADVPIVEAVKMMTYNPAKIVGCSSTKGSISIGKDADIIIFDDNINVSFVMVKGKIQIDKI